MLCEKCGKQNAIKTLKVVGQFGEEKLAVCEHCYKNNDEIVNINFEDLFMEDYQKLTHCGVCGTSLESIKRTRYVGCSECYRMFADDIASVVETIQGGKSSHVGRMPLTVSNSIDNSPTAAEMMQKALEFGDLRMAQEARRKMPPRRM